MPILYLILYAIIACFKGTEEPSVELNSTSIVDGSDVRNNETGGYIYCR